jgi:hypothetical protein
LVPFAGCAEPISAELAFDASCPVDETGLESIRKVFANLVSAAMIRVGSYCIKRVQHLFKQNPVASSGVWGDDGFAMATIADLATMFYSSFGTPLAQTEA